ncbi:hypothetical protein Igag_1328 [Ignisphaera aggregans DSM 17230]|uniref:Uncharacterized protein n=1 Tax=Ignisphaera aggregans (strain DSM 17230 / JCM 13409 / AQ1.S1) TaxID=583356 RepID=E0SQ00_IGNAA|nr:hypothetical protein Igag_1328 [Ignisphaera aggregans DSM 17230]
METKTKGVEDRRLQVELGYVNTIASNVSLAR